MINIEIGVSFQTVAVVRFNELTIPIKNSSLNNIIENFIANPLQVGTAYRTSDFIGPSFLWYKVITVWRRIKNTECHRPYSYRKCCKS